MQGKLCIVTGATDGIGRVTARALAERGRRGRPRRTQRGQGCGGLQGNPSLVAQRPGALRAGRSLKPSRDQGAGGTTHRRWHGHRRPGQQRRCHVHPSARERGRDRDDLRPQPSRLLPADRALAGKREGERRGTHRQRRLCGPSQRVDRPGGPAGHAALQGLARLRAEQARQHPLHLSPRRAAGGVAGHGELPAPRLRRQPVRAEQRLALLHVPEDLDAVLRDRRGGRRAHQRPCGDQRGCRRRLRPLLRQEPRGHQLARLARRGDRRAPVGAERGAHRPPAIKSRWAGHARLTLRSLSLHRGGAPQVP